MSIRVAELISTSFYTSILREFPGGTYELPSSALSIQGGGRIPTDPNSNKETQTLDRIFIFDLKIPQALTQIHFGERVFVRFEHGYVPLIVQFYRRIRQLFLSHFSV